MSAQTIERSASRNKRKRRRKPKKKSWRNLSVIRFFTSWWKGLGRGQKIVALVMSVALATVAVVALSNQKEKDPAGFILLEPAVLKVIGSQSSGLSRLEKKISNRNKLEMGYTIPKKDQLFRIRLKGDTAELAVARYVKEKRGGIAETIGTRGFWRDLWEDTPKGCNKASHTFYEVRTNGATKLVCAHRDGTSNTIMIRGDNFR